MWCDTPTFDGIVFQLIQEAEVRQQNVGVQHHVQEILGDEEDGEETGENGSKGPNIRIGDRGQRKKNIVLGRERQQKIKKTNYVIAKTR